MAFLEELCNIEKTANICCGSLYADNGRLHDDTTLVISPGPLSSLCDRLTVSASGPAAEKLAAKLGDFSRTEMWWHGQPVFKNSQGQLLHQSGKSGWIVGPELGKAGLSGSIAHHCPASEEKWTYFDGSKYRPASIKIECNVHTGKSK